MNLNEYVVPFLAYVLVLPFFSIFFDSNIPYLLHVVASAGLLALFWRHYRLRFRFDAAAILAGLLIFAIWVGLEGAYPLLFRISYVPGNNFFLAAKIFGFVLLAPVMEELFTRSFLTRFLVSKHWRLVPVGKFTPFSFIATALFFGIAHDRWLAGIAAGIILNVLLYKRKSVESCIVAHFTANLLLTAYIVATSSWSMW